MTTRRLKRGFASLIVSALGAGGLVFAAAPEAQAICNPQPPDYPGCTVTQINNWEDGDFDAAHAHYRQSRWGQDREIYANLGPAHNTHLRDMFSDAVVRYRNQNGENPKFTTWADFKQASDCSGGFWGAAWSFMCRMSNAMDNAVPDVNRMTLVCGGWTALGVGSAGLLALFTTVAPEAVAAGAVAAYIACTLRYIAGNLGIPTEPKQKTHAEKVARLSKVISRDVDHSLRAVVPFN